MPFRAIFLFLLPNVSLLFGAITNAAESRSLKETLAWINSKLDGFSLVASREPAVNGGYMVGIMSNFEMTVTGSGLLRVAFNSLIASGGKRDNDRTEWEADLNKYRPEDFVVTNPDRAIGGSIIFKEGAWEKVIAVKDARGLRLVMPLPADSDLHPRLLKAFRSVAEQFKAAATRAILTPTGA